MGAEADMVMDKYADIFLLNRKFISEQDGYTYCVFKR
jgi:hypothetical protein